MKKIVFVILVCVLAVGGWLLLHPSVPKPPSETDKSIWCYGVYHAVKSDTEINQYRSAVDRILKNPTKHALYRLGKDEAHTLSPEQKAECFDRIYTLLDKNNPPNRELIRSKPYCFGYLTGALGIDSIVGFCRDKCQKISPKNCEERCRTDLKTNLRKNRIAEGKKDALVTNYNQYRQCVLELQSMN